MDIKEHIILSIKDAVKGYSSLPKGFVPELGPSKQKVHGDFSTNAALILASSIGKKPREIAEEIVLKLKKTLSICDKIDIAGPGFINFHLNESAVHGLLNDILKNSDNYGKTKKGKGKKVLIEFVSANPTGPLTIAHARQAVVGDILSNLFITSGYTVLREYYLNDRGRQIRLLGASTFERYKELLNRGFEIPEDGYKGEYIIDIARKIIKEDGEKYINIPEEEALNYFQEYSKNCILEDIKKDLKDFRVKFDSFVSEKEFVESGEVEKELKWLKEKGYVYEKDSATWFKSSEFGDDKDRVLIKNTGEMTYLLPDIGYHNYKYKRGYDLLIDIMGPDHHGYIPRLKAAVEVLGHSKDSLNVLIVQLTTLYQGGEQLSMSTRAGEFVSLRDLLNEVGCDAARYFFVMRRPQSHLDFDLDIAKKETADNPVYYVQYANARISSIFAKYEEGTKQKVGDINFSNVDLSPLGEPEEVALIKFLSQYKTVVEDCINVLSPHLLTDYLENLVSKFHNYYEKHRIIGDDEKVTMARLALIEGIKIILRNGLTMLGVSVPERM